MSRQSAKIDKPPRLPYCSLELGAQTRLRSNFREGYVVPRKG